MHKCFIKKLLTYAVVRPMRRSMLEVYEEILFALTEQALTVDGIAYACNLNCVTLQKKLDFLVNQDIISLEIGLDNNVYYVLTVRGSAIAKTLAITQQLRKLQAPQIVEDALQTIAALTENEEEETKRAW